MTFYVVSNLKKEVDANKEFSMLEYRVSLATDAYDTLFYSRYSNLVINEEDEVKKIKARMDSVYSLHKYCLLCFARTEEDSLYVMDVMNEPISNVKYSSWREEINRRVSELKIYLGISDEE